MSTTPTVPDPVWDWDAGLAQGYLGFEVDPTPNENYTVEGVGSDPPAPTPETDAGAAAAALARRDALRKRLSGLAGDDAASATTTSKTTTRSSSASSSS